jgi:hypothetical protein
MDSESDPLEQLLEEFAAKETPVDARHRYALRRALMNSSQFESNAATLAIWTHWMAATGTVLAGSAVAAVFVVSVRIADMGAIRNASAAAQVPVAAAPPAVETTRSRPAFADVSFADMRQNIPVDHLWNSFQAQLTVAR